MDFLEESKKKLTLTRTALGKGHFSRVVMGFFESEEVAVKIIKKESNATEIEREIQVHSKLNHENIVKLLCVKKSPLEVFLVLEYMPDGNLVQCISKSPLDWPTRERIITGILNGLIYLHAEGVLHLDLKAENVLVGEGFNKIKLADFGLSEPSLRFESTRIRGSVCYIPPDCIATILAQTASTQPYTFSTKTDIYALAILMLVIARQKEPYNTLSHIANRMLLQIIHAGHTDDIPNDTPEPLKTLIERCRAPQPPERPEMDEVHAIWSSRYTLFEYEPEEKDRDETESLDQVPQPG